MAVSRLPTPVRGALWIAAAAGTLLLARWSSPYSWPAAVVTWMIGVALTAVPYLLLRGGATPAPVSAEAAAAIPVRKQIGFVLVTLIFVFGLGELLIRLINPLKAGYVLYRKDDEMDILHPEPLQDLIDGSTDYPVHVTVDEDGFRPVRHHLTGEQEARALRVLCLGDSITFGHAADDESCWPQALQDLCDEGLQGPSAGRPFRVRNGGHIWQTVIEQLAIWRRLGPTFRPDVVVLEYYGDNDIAECATIGIRRSFRPNLLNPLVRRSMLLRWLRRYWTARFASPNGEASAAALADFRENPDKYYRIYEENFAELAAEVRKSGAVLLAFSVPPKDALDSYATRRESTFFADLCKRCGVTQIPLPAKPNWYLDLDPHFSPYGNHRVAETVHRGMLAALPRAEGGPPEARSGVGARP